MRGAVRSSQHRQAGSTGKDGAGAFTLVEVLVVVAIIMLLLSMLLPNVNQARIRAVTAHCSSNLRQQGTAYMLYAADHEGWMPMRSPNPLISQNHEAYLRQCGLDRSLGYTFDKLVSYVDRPYADGGELRVWRCPAVDYSKPHQPGWKPRAYAQFYGGGYFSAMPFYRLTNSVATYVTGAGISTAWTEYYGAQVNGSAANRLSLLQRTAIIAGDVQYFPTDDPARYPQFRHGNEDREIFKGGSNSLLSDGSVHWGTSLRQFNWLPRYWLYSPEFLVQ